VLCRHIISHASFTAINTALHQQQQQQPSSLVSIYFALNIDRRPGRRLPSSAAHYPVINGAFDYVATSKRRK